MKILFFNFNSFCFAHCTDQFSFDRCNLVVISLTCLQTLLVCNRSCVLSGSSYFFVTAVLLGRTIYNNLCTFYFLPAQFCVLRSCCCFLDLRSFCKFHCYSCTGFAYSLAVFGGPKVRYIWDRKSDIDFENFDQVNIRERLRPLNLSFTVGVSVTISRVFFDFRYDMGLHNISKSVTYDIPADNNAADENTKNEIRFHRRDNVLSFSFGVFF